MGKKELESSSAEVMINQDLRETYWIGQVDQNMFKAAIFTLRALDDDKGPINIILASHGGEEDSGWAIYDAIKNTKAPVTITAYGMCQSMAALIIQAADTRILMPECRFMIHNGSAAMQAGVTQLLSMAKETEELTKKYYEFLAERSGHTVKKIQSLCNRETYFSAQEAVAFGFADKVMKHPHKPIAKRKK